MELKLVRSFVELAHAKNYGVAASRLFVSQSTLSKQIKTLEDRVGGELFERGRHGAKLTGLGDTLLKESDALIRMHDELAAKLRRACKGEAGHLNVGFGVSLLDYAPKLISLFRNKYPASEITLNDFSSSEQHSRLLEGTLDLGFCRTPPKSSGLSFYPVMKERLALVSSNELKIDQPLNRDLLNQIGFVALSNNRGPGLSAQVDRWCRNVGFQPRVVQYADDVLTIQAVVAAGLGVSILPIEGARSIGLATQLQVLNGEDSSWEVGLAWRENETSPLIVNFVEFVRDQKALSAL